MAIAGLLLAALSVTVLLDRQRASREDAWRQISTTGLVRVAMDAAYPPFEWVDDQGFYHGLDADLARAIASRWGLRSSLSTSLLMGCTTRSLHTRPI